MSTTNDPGVVELLADRLQTTTEYLDDETHFEDDLDAESLDLVEVAEAIEHRLGVHIPDDDLAGLDTVGDVKQYVAEHGD